MPVRPLLFILGLLRQVATRPKTYQKETSGAAFTAALTAVVNAWITAGSPAGVSVEQWVALALTLAAVVTRLHAKSREASAP